MSRPECEITWDDDGIDITFDVDGMATTIGLAHETVEELIAALNGALEDMAESMAGEMQ